MKNKILGLMAVCLLIGLIVGLDILNKWIQSKVGGIVQKPTHTSALKPPAPVDKSGVKKASDEVIRKTRLAPERTFEISVFYQGSEEIAKHKVSGKGEAYDQTGEIPNGKVKFINESDQTYGVEYYRDGMRHGPLRANYKNGNLKQEAQYQYGKFITSKEFYHDGILRMEVDYSDARDFKDGREVGIGKVYSRDGMIKYEWHLVNSDPIGFRKSYNRYGEITSAIYYDEYGVEIPADEQTKVQGLVPDAGL